MGLSASIILTAIGAILVWGVTATANGVNIQTIGVILMIVGIVGFVISMFFWSSWGGFGSARRTTVVSDGEPVVRERETVVR
jgi:hypothetical protein